MLITCDFTIIEPSKLEWKPATKVKAIFARPVVTLVHDIHFFSKLLLQTLEGDQKMSVDDIVCTGLGKVDPWVTNAKKMLANYTVTDITADGWMYCEPRPDRVVNVHQVTDNDITVKCPGWGAPYPIALRTHRGTKMNIKGPSDDLWQKGQVGDYICQAQDNHSDVWIVNKKMFETTYQFNDNTTENL